MKNDIRTLKHCRFFIYILVLFISTFLTSCGKDNISGELSDNQNLSKALYSESQDTMLIENSRYSLEAYLTRDFFPGGPIPKNSPLIADIFLVNLDSIAIPASIDIAKLYVINQNTIWISNLSPAGQNQNLKFKLEKINNNGPQWDTDIFVDVVVEIKDKKDSKSYFLISKNIKIDKVE